MVFQSHKRRRIGFRYSQGFWGFLLGSRGLNKAIRFSEDIRADYTYKEVEIRLEVGGNGYVTIISLDPERTEELLVRIKAAFNNKTWEDETM